MYVICLESDRNIKQLEKEDSNGILRIFFVAGICEKYPAYSKTL